jgi:membrane dipeptidase
MKRITLWNSTIIFLLIATSGIPMKDGAKIHDKALTVDSHTDTPFYLNDDGFDFSGRNGNPGFRNCIDLYKMQKGGLDAVFMAVFVGQGARNDSMNALVKQRAITQFDTIRKAVARYPELARLALSPGDAYRNEKEGLRSIYIGIENGYVLGNDLALAQTYFNLGARYVTLCHSRNNDICDSSTDEKGPEHGGLSGFGEDLVKEMNRLGLMVDVSHASDSSFYDILAVSRAPVIASHSDCRALCDHPRNLNDDMLTALAKNGGVIQICFLSGYVRAQEPNLQRDSARAEWHRKYPDYGALSPAEQKVAGADWDAIDDLFPQVLATVSDMVDHIDHAVKVAGIDHVGIGTDFDGGGGLADCRDASQMGTVTAELVKRGYSEEEIMKIWGGNFMRVFREVEELSERMR